MNKAALTIIGGGPAGVSAACEAAKFGVSSVLVEETDRIGGKVLHHFGTRSVDVEANRTAKRLQTDLDKFGSKISVLRNMRAWNVDSNGVVSLSHTRNPKLSKEKNEAFEEGACLFSDTVIIAKGALERILPFPGWTLPGIMTLGAANTFVNHKVFPGKRMIVAGSGPLVFLLAANLLKAGITLAAVVHLSSLHDILRHVVPLVRGALPYKPLIGLQAAVRMIKSSVPLLNGYVVLKASGTNSVQKVSAALMDSKTGRIDTNSRREFEVDSLACSYGLIPNTDISRVSGCYHYYDVQRGYWRVKVNDFCETSVPGLFAAGDCVLVRGYAAAVLEGRLAAVGALTHLGVISREEKEKQKRYIHHALCRYNAFGKAIDKISCPHLPILANLGDETCICRCEEISLGDIRSAHANGAVDINDVKRRTRLGMGHCQGRFCGQVINEVLNQLKGQIGVREAFTPRMPTHPVSFKDLAQ